MAELSNSEQEVAGSSPLLSEDTAPKYDAIFGEEKPSHSRYAKATVIGNVRNPKRFTLVEWVFLALSIVAFTGTLGITIERFVYFHNNFNNTENETESDSYNLESCTDWTCPSDFTFTVLLIANICFCFFYAVDGVLRERGFEILAVPVAISVVIIYIVVNFVYKGYEHQPLRVARLVLAVVVGPPLIILAIVIYIRNGTLQFNVVGCNKILMRVYRIRSFITTLLAFNLHLVANFAILVTARNLSFLDKPEKIIIIVFIVYMFVITPIGWFGINYELVWLTSIFGILFFPTIAYYVYKIINVGMNIKEDYWEPQGKYNGKDELYRFISVTLLFVCGLGILVYVLILVFTVLAGRDYNKGLNDKVEPPFKGCYKKLVNTESKNDATFSAS